ncbi:MAG: ABC transporter substrate-binding protein [Planctomycetota bacterium]|nr:ABC transporter substrate-binding protein [Planctomycetota bacterium]
MNRLPSIQLLLAALLCSLIGCDGNPSPPPADSAKTPVSLQLNWMPEAEHGGYYAALIHGFYAQEGLDVTIHPGGPGVPKIQNVAVGRMDFAIANADEVLIARSRDADVVALLAPLQSTPRCILVHRESGIRTLAELRNVTLSMSDGRAWARHLKSKVSLDGVQIVPYSSVAQFVARKGYAIQGYAFSEPFVARNAGSDPVVLMTAELGFNPTPVCSSPAKTDSEITPISPNGWSVPRSVDGDTISRTPRR